MRIHKLYQCFAAAVLLFLPVACDNTDYSEKSPFDNSAYLNIAASKNTETFTFNRKVTSQTKLFTVKLSYPSGRRIARLRQETLSAGGGRRRPGDLGQSADDQPGIRLPKPARRLRILLAGIRFGNSDLLGRRRRIDLPPRPRDAERHLSHEGDGRIRSPHRRDSGRKNVGNRSLGLSDRRRREGLPLRILDRHAHRAGNALPRTIRPAGTVRLENRRSARHPHVLRGRNHRIPQFENRGIRRTRRV